MLVSFVVYGYMCTIKALHNVIVFCINYETMSPLSLCEFTYKYFASGFNMTE